MRTTVWRNALVTIVALTALAACKPHSATEVAGTASDITSRSLAHTQSLDALSTTASKQPLQSTAPMKGFRSIIITSNQLIENISRIDASVVWCVKKDVLPELFKNTNAYRLDEMFECVAVGDAKYGLNVTGISYRIAASGLRYRALLPYLREALLASDITNNLSRASLGINLLCSIPHADTLRIWEEINAKIPTNSPLRAGSFPQWRAYQPRFMRNDCLEIYLDTVNHPERYERDTWWGAVEKVQYFTNDTAVAGMQFSLTVVKDPGKYWPGMKPSMDIVAIESKIENQQEIVQGKRGPVNMDRDKPFDE